ncbi:MAG: YihY/virulence factor BrkB family protein [Burkholderiales bacterium]
MIWEPTGLLKKADDAIWGGQLEAMPRWKAHLLQSLRLLLVVARDIAQGQLTLRAMSLVYTTLLALIPLLALAFSILKAFGVYNQIEPMLINFLAPLGEQGEEIAQRITQFIENLNVGVLGSVGLALLLYIAVSLMQKIEISFNFIWHITQLRSIGQRFSSYLSVLLVGPLLVFSAMGLTASATNVEVVRNVLELEPLGRLFYLIGQTLPYLLVIGAFTFLYIFLPNTRVRLVPALVGGTAGGILWQTAGWAFALFVVTSTRYSAIYSSFAILVLFMIWIYLSWLILLIGASVAFYVQHPQYLIARGGEPALSIRMRERLALVIMRHIALRHMAGDPPWNLQQLTQTLGVPMHAVQAVLEALERGGLLAESNDDPPGYLPARDLAEIPISDLMDVVRSAGENRFLSPDILPVPGDIAELIRQLNESADATLEGKSIRDLAAQGMHAPQQVP